MRIDIRTDDDSKLRVLRELELKSVTQLEGYNGIGKSTAIRLLLVCVGTDPYPENDQAWLTFKEGIGTVEVKVSDLHVGEAMTVRWRFDTRRWPTTRLIDDSWFDEISLNNRPISLAEAVSVFSVERFTGESGIVETFVAELHERKSVLEALATRILASERERGTPEAAAQELLESLIALTQHLTPEALAEDKEAAEVAARARQDAVRLYEEAAKTAADLRTASELRAGLTELATVEPGLRQELREVDARIEQLEGSRRRLQQQLSSISSGLNDRARDELQRATKNHDRNRRLLDDVEQQLAAALAASGLTRPADVAAATAQLRRQRQRVVADIASLSLNPDTRKLAEESAQRLRDSVTLGDQQILPTAFAADPSVRALAAALAERATELTGVPDPDELVALRRQQHDLDKALSKLDSVRHQAAEQRRLAALVEKHAGTIRRLSEQLNSATATKVESLRAEASALDEDYTRVLQRRANLRHQLDLLLQAGDAGSRRSQLERLLTAHDVNANSLPDALAAATEATETAHATFTARDAEAESASERLAARTRNLRSAVRQLGEARFAWALTALAPMSLDGLAEGDAAAATALTAIHRRAVVARERLTTLSERVLAAAAALDLVASKLEQPGTSSSSSRRYVTEMQSWAEREFSGYFDQPAIRDNLLGDSAESITVDINSGSVRWESDDQVFSRRLDTFSSGEQAFAYARARIGLLDSTARPARSRLICLDEFGAFMDLNRRNALVRFLADRAVAHPSDCVLLVLPLRRDVEAEANTSIGSERDHLLELKKALDVRGFVLEHLK